MITSDFPNFSDFPLSESQKNLISFGEVKTLSLLYGVSILIKLADTVDDTKFGRTGWSIFLAQHSRIDMSEGLSSVAPSTMLWPWATHFNSLSFSFCIYKIRILVAILEDLLRGLSESLQDEHHSSISNYNYYFTIAFQYWPHTLYEETQSSPCFLSQSSWKSHLPFSFRNKESCVPHSHTVTWEAFITTVHWALTLCTYWDMFCARRIHIWP